MKCIYFTYDGLLDPLGQSQVLPYIRRLAQAGHLFTVISYEKRQRTSAEISSLEERLLGDGIQWKRLAFGEGKVGMARRIVTGILALRKVSADFAPSLVHLRGFMPAILYKLSLLRIPYLYDFRGFAIEEWTDFGKVKQGSVPYILLRRIDHQAVKDASGLVVLEQAAAALLQKVYPVPAVPFKVIRTSTDLSLYRPRDDDRKLAASATIRFVWLGGARPPYRPDLALALLAQLLAKNADCTIDFINEGDHAQIHLAMQTVGFPAGKMRVRATNHEDVPRELEQYDCGLIFCDSSPWRRVCSPTKLGEYLASGLPVIALAGIDVMDEFARSTPCVRTIRREAVTDEMTEAEVKRLCAFIRHPGLGRGCQELARREFGLEAAGGRYLELYGEIAAQL